MRLGREEGGVGLLDRDRPLGGRPLSGVGIPVLGHLTQELQRYLPRPFRRDMTIAANGRPYCAVGHLAFDEERLRSLTDPQTEARQSFIAV